MIKKKKVQESYSVHTIIVFQGEKVSLVQNLATILHLIFYKRFQDLSQISTVW